MEKKCENLEKKTREKIFKKNFCEICLLLASCNDEKFLSDFMQCLFSEAEILDIGKRWLLVKELDQGKTQREIAKKFGMSLCRITRGSKMLKQPESAFQKMLNKLKSQSQSN